MNSRTAARQQTTDHGAEQEAFLNLSIHQDTLLRLLSRHQLHAEDLHCRDQNSACRLKRLILGCVANSA
ncbi:hypothetical protein [Lacimicrobium alkaliphilum]|uniref:Uncharacterized protein n=1 Tax=Lacimicrobium alkaliphilum TaxID=1526571 RepID=A0A0U2ZCD9_9ALTE|nr:hypothetical protein [Lacimicrobium alkaliphilum]ALT00181.1 hypothetical protein AT746_19200 [Lacimicrobium alkaliphilum]